MTKNAILSALTSALASVLVVSLVILLPYKAYADITTNLAGYWKFDENAGSTAADSSGNANTFTLTGATWTTGKINSALQYNGTGQYVDIGSNPASLNFSVGSSVSMCLWIFPTGTVTASPFYGLIAKRNDSLATPYAYGINYNNATFQVYTAGSNGVKGFAYLPPTNTWTYICGVIDAVNGTMLYVNGSLVSNAGGSGGVGSNTASLTVAQSGPGSGGEFFPGKIDEVGVWGRALSSSEVSQLYNGGIGLQYPFSSGTPTPHAIVILKQGTAILRQGTMVIN